MDVSLTASNVNLMDVLHIVNMKHQIKYKTYDLNQSFIYHSSSREFRVMPKLITYTFSQNWQVFDQKIPKHFPFLKQIHLLNGKC